MTSRLPIIDHSAYAAWWKCPLNWYELYVAQQTRKPADGYTDTALTLGIAVHAGLEVLRAEGRVEIPPAAVQEAGCSPDYAAWALRLVQGYAQHYPGEDFPSGHCEEPLRFPLATPKVEGLAKVDYYWKVPPEGQTIADGLGGQISLEPGWWVKEYKTKDPSRNPGNWILSWRSAAQADFQCLALAAKTGEPCRGILVDTLEKPAIYIPKRTCRGCKVQQELRSYIPDGSKWKCPLCAKVQELDLADKSRAPRTPAYYRIKVQRSPEQLALAHAEISRIAEEMQEVREGVKEPLRRLPACVDSVWGACAYFEPHSALRSAEGWDGFVKVDTLKYLGENNATD